MAMDRINCDILVVGAGVAGCSAAVTAARHNVSTMLIDRRKVPGGSYSVARLGTVCGLYLDQNDRLAPRIIPGKFIEQWLKRLVAYHPTFSPRQEGLLYTAPCSSKLMEKILLEEITAQAEQLCYYPESSLSEVNIASQLIKSVTAETPQGKVRITPRTVIDCSGIGAVMQYCQHLEPVGRKSLAPRTAFVSSSLGAIPFTWGNCQYSEMLSLKTAYGLSQLAKQAKCPPYWRFTVLRQGSYDDEINGWFNFPMHPLPSLGQVESELRSLVELLRCRLDEFARLELRYSGAEIVLRDAPVIDGRQRLTEQDLLRAIKYPDAVVCGSWPIEQWTEQFGQQLSYPPAGDYYNIPDNCLRSASVANLFAAGKGVSATPAAQAAIRVTGLAFATGERAALLAIDEIVT